MNNYTADPEPGSFDHRSGDCPRHGINVPVARAKGALGQFYCCECLLEAAQELAVIEAQKK
jgi:hypothetical protein